MTRELLCLSRCRRSEHALYHSETFQDPVVLGRICGSNRD